MDLIEKHKYALQLAVRYKQVDDLLNSYLQSQDNERIKKVSKVLALIKERYNSVFEDIMNSNVIIGTQCDIYDFKKLESTICEAYGITKQSLGERNRKRPVVQARNLIMVCEHMIAGKSLEKAGQIYNMDHSTVIHAKKNVLNNLESKDFYSMKMKTICSKYYMRYKLSRKSLLEILISIFASEK